MLKQIAILASTCVALQALAVTASSQDADVPSNLVIYVAGGAGSGMDFYSRLLARHLGRHISGNPTISVQVMPGAGGLRAATYLAQAAPKDGSAIATFPSGPLVEPLIGSRKPSYDMSQFQWIGAMSSDVSLCIASEESKFKTIDDVKQRAMIVAGTGTGAETDTIPVILNEIMQTKFRVVTGYQTSPQTFMAIERGEAHGRCGISYSSLKASKPDWLLNKKVNILLQMGARKHPELADVPLASEIIPRVEDRQLLELLIGGTSINRPFAAPPGTPVTRIESLRQAFDTTMGDPAFLQESRALNAEISPTTGAEVQKVIMTLYATPVSVVARAKRLVELHKDSNR